MRSLRRSPAKHIDLLPQDQVFRFQRCSRLEARSQDTEYQLEQIGHQDASLRRPLAASTPNRMRLRRIEFSVHTPASLRWMTSDFRLRKALGALSIAGDQPFRRLS